MPALLQKGDLVRGKKPWNRETVLGIVVEHNVLSESKDNLSETFRVFWLNGSDNHFSSTKTFSTWEVSDSLERIEDVERRH